MTKNLRIVKYGIRSTKRNTFCSLSDIMAEEATGTRAVWRATDILRVMSIGDIFLSFLIWVEALAVQEKNQPVCSATAPVLIILCSPWRRYWLVVLSFMLVKKKKKKGLSFSQPSIYLCAPVISVLCFQQIPGFLQGNRSERDSSFLLCLSNWSCRELREKQNKN